MEKPTFLLFGGIGWCGTTSLWLTLINSGYLHTGWTKENHYLSFIQNYEDWGYLDFKKFKSIYEKDLEEYNNIKYFTIETSLYKRKNLDRSLRKVKSKFISDFPPKLDHYVNFYTELNQFCQEQFKVVGDFSNTNHMLFPSFLLKVKESLSTHFDVKCLFVLRDPIRRLFSNVNSTTYSRKNLSNNSATKNFIDAVNADKLYDSTINYSVAIKKYIKIFGKENVCYLIMEEFFEEGNRKEVEKLENFINYKLDAIFPCAFVPDKGINAPKLDRLEDQWDCDHEILTPELYTFSRENLSFVYNEFEKFHGHLPADWGKPIDYGY